MTVYAIGDIQGCADELDLLLDAIKLKRKRDELWLVGDLVNRGPSSVDVMRRVMSLGKCVTCVLGNHDLHLLAAAAGVRRPGRSDTFGDVLGAPDAGKIVKWLRQQPLLHWDRKRAIVLVHAGIPPVWDVRQARNAAREVESALQGRNWRSSLRQMYGNSPTVWSGKLNRKQRIRYTINALTRMRYCDKRGRLNLSHTGPPGSQPGNLLPWFEVPGRLTKDVHIVFGHWAALGFEQRKNITALDSGCVWGGSLTAVALDPPGDAVYVDCIAR
jgi:bis(5'-nucleosyl)-tetraphosphatase (symmetrical)